MVRRFAAALSGIPAFPVVAGLGLAALSGALMMLPPAVLSVPASLALSLLALGSGLVIGALTSCRLSTARIEASRLRADVATRQARAMAGIAGLALDGGKAGYPGWHWETDRHGMIVAVSESLADGLGRSSGSLAGIRFADLFPVDAPGSGWHRLVLAMEAGQAVACAVELPLHGTTTCWQVAAEPLAGADGLPAGMRGVARDITRERTVQRQVMAELAAIQRMGRRKSKFMAAIAEDLRGPVNTISETAAHLRAAAVAGADRPPPRRLLDAMIEASAGIHQAAALLTDSSRLERGEMKLAEQEADAAEIAEVAVKMCRNATTEAEVTLVAALIDGIELRCDVTRIGQALTSLILAAIAWTPAGGTVHIDVEGPGPAGDGFAIAIASEGSLPLPYRPSDLLEPFASSHRAGLELPIARQIALLHAGDVTVEANMAGGFTFRLLLPASRVMAGMDSSRTFAPAA